MVRNFGAMPFLPREKLCMEPSDSNLVWWGLRPKRGVVENGRVKNCRVELDRPPKAPVVAWSWPAGVCQSLGACPQRGEWDPGTPPPLLGPWLP